MLKLEKKINTRIHISGEPVVRTGNVC